MMELLGLEIGIELLPIKSSDIAFTMGARGSLLEKADAYGGEIGTGSSVKLACKQLSAPISTSDGHPMLLDQLFRSRR